MLFIETLSKLISIVRSLLWYNSYYGYDPDKESPELKECFRLLNLTAGSFAVLIQKLPPMWRILICLFYLILRGLDTIEDDLTIDSEEKQQLLRNFFKVTEDESWTYDGSGPNEKHRELLVKFDVVTKEFKKLKEEYQIIIKDITRRMGEGMADYAKGAEHGMQTIKDYEMYCHHVAGLVGEGLTRLFVEAKAGDPTLLERREVIESMGRIFQQTNIIRDIREDYEEKRYFWPKEVWSKYVNQFSDLFLPENKEKAVECQSEMIFLALLHAERYLCFLADTKDERILEIIAIPQTMLIVALEFCFQNHTLFERKLKMPKYVFLSLMMQSSQNYKKIYKIFYKYIQKIHRKNRPEDPHFLDINITCSRIEKHLESILSTETTCTLPKEQTEQKLLLEVAETTKNSGENILSGFVKKNTETQDIFWYP